MATLVDHFDGPKAVPFSYPAGSNDVAFPSVINATFNGGGASGAFLACLDILSQDGKLLSRTFPDDAIPAGDTAEVTYAPFLRKRSATASGGIKFNTDPQTGGWLTLKTTGFDPVTGNGVDVTVSGLNDAAWHSPNGGAFTWDVNGFAAEMLLRSNRWTAFISTNESIDISPGEVDISTGTGAVNIVESTGTTVKVKQNANFNVRHGAGVMFKVADDAGTTKLAFFAGTPRAQFAAITSPAGGATVDTEARAAIDSILAVLGAAAGGYGLTA